MDSDGGPCFDLVFIDFAHARLLTDDDIPPPIPYHLMSLDEMRAMNTDSFDAGVDCATLDDYFERHGLPSIFDTRLKTSKSAGQCDTGGGARPAAGRNSG